MADMAHRDPLPSDVQAALLVQPYPRWQEPSTRRRVRPCQGIAYPVQELLLPFADNREPSPAVVAEVPSCGPNMVAIG